MPDGGVWKNLTTEAKSKVAETLAEFRGNYAYNLMDENVRRFNAEVPMLAQWDDHEVTNNWYPREAAGDPKKARYKETSVALLAARGAARLHRIPAGAPPSARPGAPLRELSLRPLARRVPDRHALLSRAQHRRTTRPSPAPTRRSSGPRRSAG